MGKPTAWVFDLDGTLTVPSGNERDLYDMGPTILDDQPNWPVIDEARRLHACAASIIILTGRNVAGGTWTRRWLDNHGVPHATVLMRREDDWRTGAEYKAERFWGAIDPYFRVAGAFEDDPDVCAMWRGVGVPVVHVVSSRGAACVL